TSAMKAHEKERVGALRLVLSELQKAAKEGDGDELSVLRRERKRRLEAASQFRDGGRPELAEQEEAEASLIEHYMPAQLDDAELDEIVGSEDAVLRALEGHLDCDVFLRGNVLTLEGDADAVEAGTAVVRELSEL